MSRLNKLAERITYRAAGLPITIRALAAGEAGPGAVIRRAYARHYWTIGSWQDAVEIVLGALMLPAGTLLSALYLTARNGPIVARRSGTSRTAQFIQQLWFACSRGILPPWYYVFALHEPARRARAASFLQRCETKAGVFIKLKQRHSPQSPLSDKSAFADHCRRSKLPHAAVLGVAYPQGLRLRDERLAATDLFIKPLDGSGGKGAERWDYIGGETYQNADRVKLSADELVTHLTQRASKRPLLIQPRLVNHPELADLANGALATVRVLTCLNEKEEPEVMGAVFRMAVGGNQTVDNLHAGGLASRVDLATGELSLATNLGMDARVGWLDRHPTSRARIEGRVIPHWHHVCELAKRAHSAFADRLFVGWDIAVLANGPCLVEGNQGPDVDIMQRHGTVGLCDHRFGALLAWHLLNDSKTGQLGSRFALR